jgi:hypothetical protein
LDLKLDRARLLGLLRGHRIEGAERPVVAEPLPQLQRAFGRQ